LGQGFAIIGLNVIPVNHREPDEGEKDPAPEVGIPAHIHIDDEPRPRRRARTEDDDDGPPGSHVLVIDLA